MHALKYVVMYIHFVQLQYKQGGKRTRTTTYDKEGALRSQGKVRWL
jgi:hypothetical protein